jgi:hypothetical protein
MNRFLKTLLLWLLIAALPLQGLAAVIQSSCGPSHHALTRANAVVTVHHHDGIAHSHDGHDVAMQTSADDASANVQLSDDNSLSIKHKASSCSACAACCVGAAAPPSASIWAPVYSSSEFVLISPTPLVAGFIPASLERPPKRISA